MNIRSSGFLLAVVLAGIIAVSCQDILKSDENVLQEITYTSFGTADDFSYFRSNFPEDVKKIGDIIDLGIWNETQQFSVVITPVGKVEGALYINSLKFKNKIGFRVTPLFYFPLKLKYNQVAYENQILIDFINDDNKASGEYIDTLIFNNNLVYQAIFKITIK